MNDQLDASSITSMPSVLEVFQSMILLFTFLGMILGASMGFDQISKEKDEGSLKFLVSSPIYRDAIINGKTIGAVLTLAVALAAAFLIAIAIVIFKGVIPGLDDMLRITVFFVAALLYCTVFFAIAMMMSTITRSTSMSVICTVSLVVVLIFFSILSTLASGFISQLIVGPAPYMYYGSATEKTFGSLNTSFGSANGSSTELNKEYLDYTNKLTATELQVSDAIDTISPAGDFGGIIGMGYGGIGKAILSKTKTQTVDLAAVQPIREVSLMESLASEWTKIIVLIVYLIVSFAISYVAFMRLDIR